MNQTIASVIIIVVLIGGFVGLGFLKSKTKDTSLDPNLLTKSINTSENSMSTEETKTKQPNSVSPIVTIETNYGKIVIETYPADAPKTVANFV